MPPSNAAHGVTGARIATTLRDSILAGRYRPGERIRQDALAEKHGASRLPVREALRMLEAEGLVTLVANAGAWVSTVSVEECEEMYQVRERVEPLLLRMNVPLLSDDAIDSLQSIADAMELSDEVEHFLRLDRDFHLTCVGAATTTMLGGLVLNLWNRTQHYRRTATRLFYSEGDRSVHHDHQLIVNALRRRDADEAEQVLSRHIRRSRLELAHHTEVFSPADGPPQPLL